MTNPAPLEPNLFSLAISQPMNTKTITPGDIAELRLIFNENEPVPDRVELAGYSLDLADSETVEGDLDENDQPIPPTIHAFYINPVPIEK